MATKTLGVVQSKAIKHFIKKQILTGEYPLGILDSDGMKELRCANAQRVL